MQFNARNSERPGTARMSGDIRAFCMSYARSGPVLDRGPVTGVGSLTVEPRLFPSTDGGGSTGAHERTVQPGQVTEWDEVFTATGLVVMSRAELLACGATPRGLTAAVRYGHLVRSRRDRYCLPQVGRDIAQAIRVGGRLGCVGAIRSYGVFAYDASEVHVHLERRATRLRSPQLPLRQLAPVNRFGAQLHWWPLGDPTAGDEYRVGLIDALAQSVRCQHPWHAIASVDNALHQGLIGEPDVAEIFQRVPQRYLKLRARVDGRAEAGQESVLRMIAHEAGLEYELQRWFPDVGRVDLIVEERVILEADSRAHHDGWEAHVRDRGRDLAFATLGFPSLRPAYQHTMYHPELVRDALLGLVAQPRFQHA